MIEPTQDLGGVKRWFAELEAAKKRDDKYRKHGKRILEIYGAEDGAKVPFNILYSNTDTLLPALYSATPRPVLKRRFRDENPLALAAAEAGKRMLEYQLDTNIDGYETFSEGMNSAVMDALLPGRGVTRIKYDAEVGEYLEGESNEIESEDDDEAEDAKEPMMQKESELVGVDSIAWDRVLFGYAKKWSKLPWIAFEEVIEKREAIRLFGEEMANKIQFVKDDDHTEEGHQKEKEDSDQGETKTATIYQIWDKDGGRKVRYVSKHYKDGFLKVEDDPLELTGFYPIPKPLQIIAKSNSLVVTAPYLVYEAQAKEINELTVRITKIAKAIKAKFVYDSELGSDIANLMNGDDLEGMPADKSASLSADKGFENAIWFMPIEKLVTVLGQLYDARERCKQVIYEVTGISDIIRGSTVASETATAQSIKSQWGTMRLKRSQAEVQRYCRDTIRIMLEVCATKFSEDSWVKMTGLPYATDQQVMQAQMVLQAAQQQAAQFPTMPGQEPQIPPQIQQAIQQAQQTLQQPQWSQVLGLLRDDIERSYKIDIETNSTVMPEATEDKQNTTEALTSLGQYITQSMPAVQQGILPFEAFKSILLKVSRQFDFGDDIEQELKQMQQPPAPQQPQDNSLQVKQMELQAKQASDQASAQLDAQKMELSRMIEEGKAKTQMHIEQMRIESQKDLEQMRIQSQQEIESMKINSNLQLEMFKAELQSKTSVDVATISKPEDTGINNVVTAHNQSIKSLVDVISKPKKVVMNDDGSMVIE